MKTENTDQSMPNRQELLNEIEALKTDLAHCQEVNAMLEKTNIKLRDENSDLNMQLSVERQNAKKHSKLSMEDYLTGLYNRRYVNVEVNRMIAEFQRRKIGSEKLGITPEITYLGVLYADVDDFKTVNDSFGHDVGDQWLQTVGQSLSETANRQTDIVARIGGDEFVVIMETTTPELEGTLCEKFASILAARNPQIKVSIGYYYLPMDEKDVFNKIIKQADMNMYRQKEARKKILDKI